MDAAAWQAGFIDERMKSGHTGLPRVIGTCSECRGPVERRTSITVDINEPGVCRDCGAREAAGYGPVIQMQRL